MKIQFVGGVGRVTGSCTLLENSDGQFIVDCGMIQGEQQANIDNARAFPFDPRTLKFVLLTHAHLDHCGLIPKLYKDGFVGKVYCTRATAFLAIEIMKDAAQIGAPYSKNDVNLVNFEHLDGSRDFVWGKLQPVDQDLMVALFRNAHVLGSVAISVVWGPEPHQNIWFTGDLGNNRKGYLPQPLLKGRHDLRNDVVNIVCESTYGSRTHKPWGDQDWRAKNLKTHIVQTLIRDSGTLVIPAFSLHRTQEVLFDLYYLLSRDDELKTGTYFDYLSEKFRFHSRDWFLKSTYDRIMAEVLSEGIVKENLLNEVDDCYSYYFILKETQIVQLLNSIIDKNNRKMVEPLFEEEDGTYSFWAKNGDLDKKDLEIIIQELEKAELGKRIYYRLDRESLNKKAKKMNEKIVQGNVEWQRSIQIYLDSPLAKKITKIYGKEITKPYYNGSIVKYPYLNSTVTDCMGGNEEESLRKLKDLFTAKLRTIGPHGINWITPKDDVPQGPCIVISSSGMCSNGPILKHLDKYLAGSNNMILLCGFSSGGTNGAILSDLNNMPDAQKALSYVSLFNHQLKCSNIHAKVALLDGYSGHADQSGLLKFLLPEEVDEKYRGTAPYIFLNHGRDDSRKSLKEAINERSETLLRKYGNKYPYSTEVILPSRDNGWYDLETHEWVEEFHSTQNLSSQEPLIAALNNLTAAIKLLTEKVSNI